jgi:hypothetical protein
MHCYFGFAELNFVSCQKALTDFLERGLAKSMGALTAPVFIPITETADANAEQCPVAAIHLSNYGRKGAGLFVIVF